MITHTFTHLSPAINSDGWEWLQNNAPDYATAVQKEVAAGKSPDQIYRYMLVELGLHREPLARRCRQAAAYLQTAGEG